MAPDPRPPGEPGHPAVECWLKAAFAKRAERRPQRPDAVLRAVERRLAIERERSKPRRGESDSDRGVRPDDAKH